MMNPTSNKKDFEDLSTALRDLAYSYIEKYSPSKQQLKTYLLKKYLNEVKCSFDFSSIFILSSSHIVFTKVKPRPRPSFI